MSNSQYDVQFGKYVNKESQIQKPFFILSFDCEGKWGMADKLTEHDSDTLTNERLREAYQNLVQILTRYDIKATFAFVGAFIMAVDEYLEHKEWFRDIEIAGENWLSRFRIDAKNERFDGWFLPEVYDYVKNNSLNHEIAAHGFTHLPLGEKEVSVSAFHHEMKMSLNVAQLRREKFSTLIYPRNQIGYTGELLSYGIIGYRGSRLLLTKRERIMRNLQSFDLLQSTQDTLLSNDGIVHIPAGYFFGRQVGLRRLIPRALIHKRWRDGVDYATSLNRVIHMWAHPHNFIDVSGQQFELFEEVLGHISDQIKDNRLDNVTQKEYCDLILDGSGNQLMSSKI